MKPEKQEFKTLFAKKFKDMEDVLFNNFSAGILSNDNKVNFVEDKIDGLIKFYTFSRKENLDIPQFKDAYHKKVEILTKKIFYAIDKGIEGNKIKVELEEGNITCFITVKTAPHVENKLFGLSNKVPRNEESDGDKHMII